MIDLPSRHIDDLFIQKANKKCFSGQTCSLMQISFLCQLELDLFLLSFRHISLVPQFHAFVGSLTNLTHLKLSNCCTDQLLAVIGANCVNLEVLDAEEDSEMMTTDHGLAFLANCRNLRCGQKHIFL